MPADLDSPGDNPFYSGYHEGPPIGKTRFPSMSSKDPMESVKWTLKHYFPYITPHVKDWVTKELEIQGIMEQAGKPNFESLVKEFAEDFHRKNNNIIDKHIKDTGDDDVPEKRYY